MIATKVKPSQVREQILDTASRLFFHQGYNLTGINQIIAEAGVAKASLYQHFPSKEDLCVAYLSRRHLNWFNELELQLAEIADPSGKIKHVFDFKAQFISNGSFGGCSFLKIISEVPNDSVKIRAQVTNQKNHFRQLLKTLVAGVDFIPRNKVSEVADEILMLTEGATVMCQVYQEVWPMDVAKKGGMKLLEKYMK